MDVHKAYQAIALAVIQTPLINDPAPSMPIALIRQGTVRVVEQGRWPTSSSVLCWHCCHPFTGPPLPMPTHYDDRLDIFHVTGTFCSWECMKAYNLDSRSHASGRIDVTITSMFRKVCTIRGTTRGIRSAPPRIKLEAFGGDMTIDEFRSTNKTFAFLPPKLILHQPVIEEIPARLRPTPPAQTLNAAVSFQDVTVQNDMVKLRRTKPLASQNLLVKALGVQVGAKVGGNVGAAS
jgi:hypothetical protein